VEIYFLGNNEVFFRYGLGHMYWNIAIILLITVVFIEIIVINRALVRLIGSGLQKLDNNVAEALELTVKNIPGILKETGMADIEPINPIQAVFAQILQDKFKPQINVKEIQRASDGKFESADTSLTTEQNSP